MIETPRPLEEKMTLFWHNHFATSYRTIENSYHMYMQKQFLRANALGSSRTCCSTDHPRPRDDRLPRQQRLAVGRPNENLARELMELFGLGVGNYTENDIKEGARALTGYSFRDDEFVFNHENHDKGNKNILGRRGNLDGEGFVSARSSPAPRARSSWRPSSTTSSPSTPARPSTRRTRSRCDA
jgi:uncharacterized protein (DUF1800 family)